MLVYHCTLLVISSLALGYGVKIIVDLLKEKKISKKDIKIGLFALGLGLTIFLINYSINKLTNTNEICGIPSPYGKIDKTRILIDAIAEYESGNDTTAKNPNSSASGHLQILKILVDDANKIIGEKRYTYQDRFDRTKAEEIWHIIQNKYNPKGDIEIAIRLWNQGPGYTKENSQFYYERVFIIYNRMINEKLDEIARNYKSWNLE